jgi:membrane protein required for colicin V production
MTVIDVIILALLIASMLNGFRLGFVVEVATILGAVVALGVAKLEYVDVRHVLAHLAPKSPWLTVIAYLLVFLLVWGGIMIVAYKVRFVVRLLLLGWLDRLGGAIIGLLQGLILVELLVYLGKRVPNHAIHHAVKHSLLGPSFQQVIPYIHHWFPNIPR